ncbi:MAG: hypothetical protein L7U45_07365 [Alphaproteobacteria bacterium]|nr:hypothetical protein [Alphaproteobacteria bacterium]
MGRVLAALIMLCVATLASAAYADPALATDKTMTLDFAGERVSAAYIYTKRELVEAMAEHYCRHRYGKKAVLGPGACTKMLPLEANRCRAEAICR